MDKKQIRKEIAVLINSIKEHSDSIGDKEHIPQLELELILHKIEKLYQKSIVFNHLNSLPEVPVVKVVPVTPVETPKAELPKVETPTIEAPTIETPKAEIPKIEIPKVEVPETITPKIETPAPEPPKAELKPEVIPPAEVKKVAPEPVKEEPKPEPKIEVEQEIIPEIKAPEVKPAEPVITQTPPVVEPPKPQPKPVPPVAKPVTNIQMSPIADLRTAIGLNDKFQFANELFAGQMKEYDIALQHLNGADGMEPAMNYFNSLQQLYSWDMENDTVKRLQTLVQRRYS